MEAPDEQAEREWFRVHEWRLNYYETLGFERYQAEIMEHFGVDPHDAEKLIVKGCSPRLAVRILT